jgi:hypothetical protein
VSRIVSAMIEWSRLRDQSVPFRLLYSGAGGTAVMESLRILDAVSNLQTGRVNFLFFGQTWLIRSPSTAAEDSVFAL